MVAAATPGWGHFLKKCLNHTVHHIDDMFIACVGFYVDHSLAFTAIVVVGLVAVYVTQTHAVENFIKEPDL